MNSIKVVKKLQKSRIDGTAVSSALKNSSRFLKICFFANFSTYTQNQKVFENSGVLKKVENRR